MVFRKEPVIRRVEKLREYAADLRSLSEIPAVDFEKSSSITTGIDVK